MLVAASFAEEGEFETARLILKQGQPRKTDRPSVQDHKRQDARPTLKAN